MNARVEISLGGSVTLTAVARDAAGLIAAAIRRLRPAARSGKWPRAIRLT